MYKLYLNNGIITQIDKSEDINDFVYTMSSYIKDNPDSRFIIKEQNKEKGDSARFINGLMDYALFVEEHNVNKSENNKSKRLRK